MRHFVVDWRSFTGFNSAIYDGTSFEFCEPSRCFRSSTHRQIMVMTGLAGLGRLLGTSGHFIGV